MDRLIAIADHVYVLGGTVPIDGRISWVSRSERGWAPIHSYLIIDGRSAILVDTGLPVHEATVLWQLQQALDKSKDLSILFSRVVEFDSLGNAAAIERAFPVTAVYAHFDVENWLSFHPKFDSPSGLPPRVRRTIDYRIFRKGGTIEVGDTPDARTLDVLHGPMRLLITAWLYDRKTATLFTSDAFGHVTMRAPEAPHVVDETTDETTFEVVREHLITKFDWLLAADTTRIRAELAEIFESHHVETLAPIYGCVIRGHNLVMRHYEMMDRALAELMVRQVGGDPQPTARAG